MSSPLLARRMTEVGILLAAATCEVGGDAMIRVGLRGRAWLLASVGVATLGSYGVIVNLLAMDFSRLLATYVAIFAVVSVVLGRLLFREAVPPATAVGLLVIVVGSGIIQMGQEP